MPTLFLVVGPWAAGKTTLVPRLQQALPDKIVFDWDLIIPGLSEVAAQDVRTAESTWTGLLITWSDIIVALLAGGHDVVLCGPKVPDDFAGFIAAPQIECIYLDCPDSVLLERLQARGVAPQAIAEEREFAARLRRSSYTPVAANGRPASALAAEIASHVQAFTQPQIG